MRRNCDAQNEKYKPNELMDRRDFLSHSGSVLGLGALAPGALAQDKKELGTAAPRRPLKKGIARAAAGVKGSVLENTKAVRAAGFDGVEMTSDLDQEAVLRDLVERFEKTLSC